MRLDTGHLTYRGEDTRGGATLECWTDESCRQHYVVRLDGTWVRAYHNETDAARAVEYLQEVIDR